jgi:hypothetical protein
VVNPGGGLRGVPGEEQPSAPALPEGWTPAPVVDATPMSSPAVPAQGYFDYDESWFDQEW